MPEFLHERRDFDQLLAVVADARGLDPSLVEKDYWIMHVLWGLQAQGFQFELKGGTSLSKGFGVIHRFSEDIDIRIEPPADMTVKTGRNQDKPAHVASRRDYYEALAERIRIPGIDTVQRDTLFDDEKLRSAGIRLVYGPHTAALAGVKDGILLELGFDDTAPNRPVTISSWAWDTARERGVSAFDNRAAGVLCYAPTHTFVETPDHFHQVPPAGRVTSLPGQLPAPLLRCLLPSGSGGGAGLHAGARLSRAQGAALSCR